MVSRTVHGRLYRSHMWLTLTVKWSISALFCPMIRRGFAINQGVDFLTFLCDMHERGQIRRDPMVCPAMLPFASCAQSISLYSRLCSSWTLKCRVFMSEKGLNLRDANLSNFPWFQIFFFFFWVMFLHTSVLQFVCFIVLLFLFLFLFTLFCLHYLAATRCSVVQIVQFYGMCPIFVLRITCLTNDSILDNWPTF